MHIAIVEIDGSERCCLLEDRGLFVLDASCGLERLLALGGPAVRQLRTGAARRPWDVQGEAHLRPPRVPNAKVLGIGMNFTSFVNDARRLGMAVPLEPFWFARGSRCLTGAFGEIRLPRDCDDLDYEGELVIVMGKPCYKASREEARMAIAGYTLGNDLTMRRQAAKNAVLGKFFDTHAPIGPAIVTADEIPDPQDLEIRTYVNGELRQRGSTSEMILDCYGIVEALSSAMTLYPGDLIFTGTPGGCGIGQQPPTMLKTGDRVRVEVDEIGAIENLVVAMDCASKQP